MIFLNPALLLWKNYPYGRHRIYQSAQIVATIPKTKKLKYRRRKKLYQKCRCHLSVVTCHVSGVPCHMSLTPTPTATDPSPANSPTINKRMLLLILTKIRQHWMAKTHKLTLFGKAVFDNFWGKIIKSEIIALFSIITFLQLTDLNFNICKCE